MASKRREWQSVLSETFKRETLLSLSAFRRRKVVQKETHHRGDILPILADVFKIVDILLQQQGRFLSHSIAARMQMEGCYCACYGRAISVKRSLCNAAGFPSVF